MDPLDLLERRDDLLARKFDALYDCLDVDGSGELEASDFLLLAERLKEVRGWRGDEPACERVVTALTEFWELMLLCVDADESGTVSRAEFTLFERILSEQTAEFGQAPPWALEFVEALFAALDRDEDGNVGPDEYAEYLHIIGSARDAAAAFARLDIDGSGVIEVGELEALVAVYFTSNDPDDAGNLLLTGGWSVTGER